MADDPDYNDPYAGRGGDHFQRKRRKRQQVPRACQPCARAKRKCDGERPCKRCSDKGMAELCQDVVTKRQCKPRGEVHPGYTPGAMNESHNPGEMIYPSTQPVQYYHPGPPLNYNHVGPYGYPQGAVLSMPEQQSSHDKTAHHQAEMDEVAASTLTSLRQTHEQQAFSMAQVPNYPTVQPLEPSYYSSNQPLLLPPVIYSSVPTVYPPTQPYYPQGFPERENNVYRMPPQAQDTMFPVSYPLQHPAALENQSFAAGSAVIPSTSIPSDSEKRAKDRVSFVSSSSMKHSSSVDTAEEPAAMPGYGKEEISASGTRTASSDQYQDAYTPTVDTQNVEPSPTDDEEAHN
eukprot:gb/GECG01009673.1/.p1 GENE.gb/GECG01009673.1/~~gb/GECG01009673.1/.p1  ORF type:complete len:346 (+),score=36.13 gb/GECG01009673.1/:1-1038(+)